MFVFVRVRIPSHTHATMSRCSSCSRALSDTNNDHGEYLIRETGRLVLACSSSCARAGIAPIGVEPPAGVNANAVQQRRRDVLTTLTSDTEYRKFAKAVDVFLSRVEQVSLHPRVYGETSIDDPTRRTLLAMTIASLQSIAARLDILRASHRDIKVDPIHGRVIMVYDQMRAVFDLIETDRTVQPFNLARFDVCLKAATTVAREAERALPSTVAHNTLSGLPPSAPAAAELVGVEPPPGATAATGGVQQTRMAVVNTIQSSAAYHTFAASVDDTMAAIERWTFHPSVYAENPLTGEVRRSMFNDVSDKLKRVQRNARRLREAHPDDDDRVIDPVLSRMITTHDQLQALFNVIRTEPLATPFSITRFEVLISVAAKIMAGAERLVNPSPSVGPLTGFPASAAAADEIHAP